MLNVFYKVEHYPDAFEPCSIVYEEKNVAKDGIPVRTLQYAVVYWNARGEDDAKLIANEIAYMKNEQQNKGL